MSSWTLKLCRGWSLNLVSPFGPATSLKFLIQKINNLLLIFFLQKTNIKNSKQSRPSLTTFYFKKNKNRYDNFACIKNLWKNILILENDVRINKWWCIIIRGNCNYTWEQKTVIFSPLPKILLQENKKKYFFANKNYYFRLEKQQQLQIPLIHRVSIFKHMIFKKNILKIWIITPWTEL